MPAARNMPSPEVLARRIAAACRGAGQPVESVTVRPGEIKIVFVPAGRSINPADLVDMGE